MADKPATRTRSTSRTTRPRAAAKPKEETVAPPPLVFESTSDDKEEERVPLFSIDGYVCTVPAEPSPAIGIRFLAASRNGSPFAAGFQLIEDMIGADAYQRFLDWKGLDDDVVSQVIEECTARALGGPERAAKN